MAVVTLYMSDRDPEKTFNDKKQADQYDKMLELAENVSLWLEQKMPELDEKHSEAIGLLIAENKDKLALAFKGKSDALSEVKAEQTEDTNKATPSGEKVTKIQAAG